MKFYKVSLIVIATMLFSNLKAQKQNQFNKISVSFIKSSTDQSLNDKTKGLEFEYYLNLKKRYGILISL